MLKTKIKFSDLNKKDGILNVPLSLNFSTETQQGEDMERYFDITKKDVINPILDYEKVKLHPVSYDSMDKMIDSMNIKLHFLYNNTWTETPTKFESIGFTNNDIENKSTKLEKSFIRLSFFDSNDLKTQNLLFYSIVYVDYKMLYEKYIQSLSMDEITTEFLIENPKISKRIRSFEGFNIYLFKDDISKSKITDIYMRVDFSSALNGRTTLFTQKGSNPLKQSGYTMKELLDMMFIKVVCDFDSVNNRYIYYFVDKDSNPINGVSDDNKINKVINLDLYQAKVV